MQRKRPAEDDNFDNQEEENDDRELPGPPLVSVEEDQNIPSMVDVASISTNDKVLQRIEKDIDLEIRKFEKQREAHLKRLELLQARLNQGKDRPAEFKRPGGVQTLTGKVGVGAWTGEEAEVQVSWEGTAGKGVTRLSRSLLETHPGLRVAISELDESSGTGRLAPQRDGEAFDAIVGLLRGSDGAGERLPHARVSRECEELGLQEVYRALGPREWAWEPSRTSVVSLRGSRVSLPVDALSCVVLGSRSVASFSVRLDGPGSCVSVGLGRRGLDLEDPTRCTHLRYAVSLLSGFAAGGPSTQMIPCLAGIPVSGCPPGTIISVKLDIHTRALSFALDGQWLAPTFPRLPEGVYYPYICIGSPGTSVSLI